MLLVNEVQILLDMRSMIIIINTRVAIPLKPYFGVSWASAISASSSPICAMVFVFQWDEVSD